MVVITHTTPCFYIINGTELRRNRHHLRLTNEGSYVDDEDDVVCNNKTSHNTDDSDWHDSTIPITTTSETRSQII